MRRLLAVLAVVVATFALATPAQAGAIYPGAGYKLTGINTATASFVVPQVDCSGVAEDGVIQFGLFATDLSWRAVVNVACIPAPQFSIVALGQNGSAGFGGDQVARPGHSIRIQIITGPNQTKFTVADLTINKHVELTQRPVSTVLAVGAYSEHKVPMFASPAIAFTANSGKKLAQLDYVRHVQVRNGVTLIGSGFPWNDGVHFRLYYKHH